MSLIDRETLVAQPSTSMAIIVQLAALRRYIALRRWPLAYRAADKLDALLSQLMRPA